MKKYFMLPLFLIIPLLARIVICGSSFGDSLSLLGLLGLYFGLFYIQDKKEPLANKEILNRIADLEEQLKINKEKVNAITLGNSFKR